MNRDFYLYFGARFISIAGDSIGTLALLWWILTTTGSHTFGALILSVYSACFGMALLVFGVVADSGSRRNIMMCSEVAGLAITSVLCWLSAFEQFNLMLLALLLASKGVAAGALSSASTGFIAEVAQASELGRAFKYVSHTIGMASLLGGVTGGIIVSFGGSTVAIAADSATYAISFVLLANIGRTGKRLAPCDEFPSVFDRLKRGLSFFWKSNYLRRYIGFLLAFNFVYTPLPVLLPILVKEVYLLDVSWLGYMEGALALGMMFGGVMANWIERQLGSRYATMSSMLLMGFGFLLTAFSSAVESGMSAFFLIGISFTLLNINVSARVWALVPIEMGSRITSLFTLLGRIAASFSLGFVGVMLATLEVRGVLLLLGGLWLSVCLAYFSQRAFIQFISSNVVSIHNQRPS